MGKNWMKNNVDVKIMANKNLTRLKVTWEMETD